MSELAFIALGSNLGDRAAHLARARAALSLIPTSRLVAASSVEETAPLGAMAQSPYLNQMVALRTSLAPDVLLRALHGIEQRMGRVRAQRWGSRIIDLDIVRQGARTLRSESLVLPHPGLAHRDFWQRELAELELLVGDAA